MLNSLKVACIAVVSVSALAGPLDGTKIASDAKWLVHLDVESLRSSTLGNFILKDFVQPKLDEAKQMQTNLSINVSNISSITAYGPAFAKDGDAVLMISTTADVKKDLDTIAGMFLLNAGTNAPFVLVEKSPLPLYTFNKSIYIAPAGNTVYVAKSKDQVLRAHQVVLGKEESLGKGGGFKQLPAVGKDRFFVVMADGFGDVTGIPPQAQILKEATGGQLALGEKDGAVCANLCFQGKDDMATTRIQQVIQGLVALVSLSQEDNDLTQLAASTKVTSDNKNVVMTLEYPVEKTIKKIKDGTTEKPHSPRPQKNKTKRKQQHAEEVKPKANNPSEDAPPSDELAEKDKDSK